MDDLNTLAENEIAKIRCYKLQAILEIIIKNINLIKDSPNSLVVTVSKANLFDLALQYYGDINYWVTIAEANKLTTNRINTQMTIVIPPKPSSNPGGVFSV